MSSGLNNFQLSVLEAAFANNCYLTEASLTLLAMQTGLGKNEIMMWFSQRRHCIRERKLEETHYFGKYVFVNIHNM